jgi:hypothetical protein
MTKIFESPDKGKTVYSREAGQTERTLHSMDDDIKDMFATIREDRLWEAIRNEAKTNIALQNSLEHAIMIYNISKEYKDGI